VAVKHLMTNACLYQQVNDRFNFPGFVFFGDIAVFNLLPDYSWNLPKHSLHQHQIFFTGVFRKIILIK
jgi:hypothetical protein